MSLTALPVVWLSPPGWPLPEELPPLGDLAPAEPGGVRVGVLRDPVPVAEAAAVAARLAGLPGVTRAGWLEPDRVVIIGPSGPVPLLRRVAGRWAPTGPGWPGSGEPGPGDEGLAPGTAAVLSAGRLRLGLARRRAQAETGSEGGSSGGGESGGAGGQGSDRSGDPEV